MANPESRKTQAAPLLLLTFNRPALFKRVLDALDGVQPREVFVSIDGPRKGRADDQENCRAVLALAERIPWAKPLHLKVASKNLGCGPAVNAAISWALEHTTEIIILEDDCLPSPSFLPYCDELLERYRDDHRVMQIGGSNWGAAERRFNGHSYAFTSFAPIWGWATWRRAWQLYDFRLESWPRIKSTGMQRGMSIDPHFRRFLEQDWEMVRAGGGTWDHQWQYTLLRHHGLNICPARNLIRNIGFDGDGTQMISPDRIFSRVPLQDLSLPICHPPEVSHNASVESVFARIYWQKMGWPYMMFKRLVRHPRLNASLRKAWRNLIPRPS